MALFRTERGIGRGETAESQLEAPLLAAFVVFSMFTVFVVQTTLHDPTLTVALAISLAVFTITLLRVEFGLYLLIVAMLLSPEVSLGGVGSGERNLIVRYDDFLIIVVFMGVLIRSAFERNTQFMIPSPINLGIALYMTICLVSTLRAFRNNVPSWDWHAALFVLLKMTEFYMVYFLVGNAVRDLRAVRRQLTVFFLVGLVISGYGIYSIGAMDRVTAPFEGAEGSEPNTLGGYLVLITCIGTGLLTQAKTWRMRWALFALVAVTVTPFLYTLSRASYLAAIAAVLALGIVTRRFSLIGAVCLVLILSPYVMPQEVKDRVNYTFQGGDGDPVELMGRSTGLQVDKSTAERIYVWDKVMFNLQVWPWFGGGVAWGLILDSQYARVIIETGLLGLITFVFLQFQILRSARQTYLWSSDWVARGLAFGLFSAMVGLIVHSLGTITFLIIRIMEPFWYLTALTMVARSVALREHWDRQVLQWREAQRAGRAEAPALDAAPAPVRVKLHRPTPSSTSRSPAAP